MPFPRVPRPTKGSAAWPRRTLVSYLYQCSRWYVVLLLVVGLLLLINYHRNHGAMMSVSSLRPIVPVASLRTFEGRIAAAKDVLSHLKSGVHYSASYDIATVVDTDPTQTVGGTVGPLEASLKFRWMNRTTSKYPFRWVAAQPRVALAPYLFSPEECDRLAKLSESDLAAAELRLGNMSKTTATDTVSTAFTVRKDGTDMPSVFGQRIEEFLGVPLAQGDRLLVARYHPQANFKPHNDTFTRHKVGEKVRAITVVMYLHRCGSGWRDVDDGRQSYGWAVGTSGTENSWFDPIRIEQV